MKITNKTVELINAYFLTIDELVYLYTLFINEDWHINITPASIKKLQSLNLLQDTGLTPTAQDLVVSATILAGDDVKTDNIDDEKFNEIWLTFPRDDGFQNFEKTRLIRYNKQMTKADYQVALREYTHEELLHALQAEIAFRSNSTKENMFKYMPASHNWFKRKCYEPFINSTIEEKIHEYGKEIS